MTQQDLRTPGRASRPGAERRSEKRYQVDLPGTMEAEGVACAAMISDLSPSGALVTVEQSGPAFRAGARVTLVLKEYGPIEASVAHVGGGFYGLRFVSPHLLRDHLTHWLRQDVGAQRFDSQGFDGA